MLLNRLISKPTRREFDPNFELEFRQKTRQSLQRSGKEGSLGFTIHLQ